MPPLDLQEPDRLLLQQWLAAFGTPQQVALRCQIVLAAADGQPASASAQRLGVNRKTVLLWRERFAQAGPGSLWVVAPGRGCKATHDAAHVAAIVDATRRPTP